MLSYKNVVSNLFKKCLKPVTITQKANKMNRYAIGNRDWVGFGSSGNAYYNDDLCFPFPAVRFKENNNELLALREKEKGDWRKLSCEEKKILYRASFRQTFSEFQAPTGEWKGVVGISLFLISIGMWIFYGFKIFVAPPLPQSFSDEWRAVALRRKIDLKHGHLRGISSQWDYENDKWK